MITTGNYQSKVLLRPNRYTAVLPNEMDNQTKVVFLLHGFGFDESSWLYHTPLLKYAEDYNVAFFCPNGGISFYTDHADGENYAEAIGEEFFLEMNRTFSLDFAREKVAIAGFSMGGYGAVLLGLRFSTLYSRIGSFSPAFVFYKKERGERHFQQVFSKGDYGSENDGLVWYKKLLDQQMTIPPIDFACGIEDPLCEQTELFIEGIQQMDQYAQVTFRKQPGFHDFGLWNNDLKEFLELFTKDIAK